MPKLPAYISFISLFLIAETTLAQTPDWSSKIASIFYNNCTVCHHEEGIAPFSLIEYGSAVAYGFSIQAQVNSKKMPPWPPDPEYSHFADELVLSDSDLTAINDWVNGGMPSGDLSSAPDPPIYSSELTMLQPDDTVELPLYTLSTNDDSYRTFVIHSNFSETKYINSIEFIPGDKSIVHHAIFKSDTSDVYWELDQADTIPGFETISMEDLSPTTEIFGGWAPGTGLFRLPPNMGTKVLPNSDIIVNIHYAPGGIGQTDSSKLYLKFCSVPDTQVRQVYRALWLFHQPPVLIDTPFFIYANEVLTFHEVSFPTQLKSLIGIAPHSHLLCKSWQVRMVSAPGDTTNLIHIPQWSFYWQYSYLFTKVIKVPAGAVMLGEATFDNTSNNPDNPNDPPVTMHEGGQTDQEMMRCSFWVMEYEDGDENLILDSAFYGLPTSISTPDHQLLSLHIYPNPVSDILHVVSDLPAHDVMWQITDLYGVAVKSARLKDVYKGIYVQDLDVSDLPAGIYHLRIQSGGAMAIRELVVLR